MPDTFCAVGDINLPVEAIFVDSVGAAVDISAATTLQILIKRPDGTTLAKTAVFTNTGTDGKIRYLTISGDITVKGVYEYQGRAVWGGNDRTTFEKGKFTAIEKIGA